MCLYGEEGYIRTGWTVGAVAAGRYSLQREVGPGNG